MAPMDKYGLELHQAGNDGSLWSIAPTLTENEAASTSTTALVPSWGPTRASLEDPKQKVSEDIGERHDANDIHETCTRCHAHDKDIEAATEKYQIIASSEEDESKLVTWNGPTDPEKPINMSKMKKWRIVAATGLMTFCVTFASSVFSTTTSVTAKLFGVSHEVMILGMSLYVLGFALGPLIWGPLSEAFGRTRPLFAGMIIFCIFQIPIATAQNLETLFICRFLAGAFGSAPLAIISGMYVDFMEPVDRGMATSAFLSAVFSGPAAGPVIGSFIVQSSLGWRWTTWITLIMAVTFTFITWLVTPETCEPILLKWKAQRLRHETKDWALHSKSEEDKLDAHTIVTNYLTKPLRMIISEPILIILTLYMSLVYGILYLTFEAYPLSFQTERGWSAGVASLPFISLLIGVVLACITIGTFSKTWYAKRLRATKKLNPEDRLPTMIAGSILLPIGLFWFAWTSDPDTSWVPQVIAGVAIGMGIILVFMSGVVYMVDVYLRNANSAVAVNTFVRSLVGASFPLFAPSMFESLDVNWATSVLGFVCLALIPFPLVFWFYGKRIRSWSKYAFNLG